MFDYETIKKNGTAKGLRDLDKCSNSNLSMIDAFAQQIALLQDTSENLLTHAIYFDFFRSKQNIKNFMEAEHRRIPLFESILTIDLTAQFLSVAAEKQGYDIIGALFSLKPNKTRYFLYSNVDTDDWKREVTPDNFVERIKGDSVYKQWSWEKDLREIKKKLIPIESFRRAIFGEPSYTMAEFLELIEDTPANQAFVGELRDFIKQSAIDIWKYDLEITPAPNAQKP